MIKNNLNPLAGFSTITFYAYGREICVHGFLQREVREMKRMDEKIKDHFVWCR